MGYEARIVDEDMSDMPVSETGRLAVRGPTGCRYLADDRQAAYVRDGWNLTGDSFWRDEEGRFHFAARSDDMIVSAGYNIAGPEVEAALLAHPAVAECAVVGAPDAARGEIVQAHVVPNPGAAADTALIKALQDHVKATIAPYKYPRSVVLHRRLAEDPDRQDPALQTQASEALTCTRSSIPMAGSPPRAMRTALWPLAERSSSAGRSAGTLLRSSSRMIFWARPRRRCAMWWPWSRRLAGHPRTSRA